MLKIFMMVIIFAGIFYWEAPGLIRNKEKKELIVFSILLSIGFALSIVAIRMDFI